MELRTGNAARIAPDRTRPTGFEPVTCGLGSRRPVSSNTIRDNDLEQSPESVLADCLALLEPVRPDLARIVGAWDGLPEPIRAGLLALVRSAVEGKA